MTLELPEQYAKSLGACATLGALRALMVEYTELAKDAAPIVAAMDDAAFAEFAAGLKLERRGQFAGEDFARKYAAVMMPEPMFTIARIANEYHAPFSVAWRRIQEVRPDLLDLREPA